MPHEKSSGGGRTQRLCAQVEEVLNVALWTAGDPVLRELYVANVETVRGAALLRVTFEPAGDPGFDLDEGAARLARAGGYLRDELAQAMTRKRVPRLDLILLPSLRT